MNINSFKKRLTEVLFYPKLCRYADACDNADIFISKLDDYTFVGKNELVVYIHVPFCNKMCLYCSYFKESIKRHSHDSRRQYFNAICREIELYQFFGFFDKKKVKAIQFGGGTPSLVEPYFIEMVIDKIQKTFDCSQCDLITMEGNVSSLLDKSRLLAYRDIGIQRLSIGVQTFDETLRKKLNIESNVKQIYTFVDEMKKIGFADYSMDLMYNLPGEEINQVRKDIIEIDQLEPTFIDIYSLNVFPNTLFKKLIDSGNFFAGKPSVETNISMARQVVETFKSLNYNQVMSFTYSKRTKICPPHVDLFFNGGNVLGLGASSRSYLSDLQYRNIPDINLYISSIMENKIPIDCGMVVSETEWQHQKMVFFPLYLQINKADIPDIPHFHSVLQQLIALGYVNEDETSFSITQEGRIWTGNIAACFFSEAEKEKHNLSFLRSLHQNENPYNQDRMGVVGLS